MVSLLKIHRSLYVCLPKDFTKELNWKKGEEVLVIPIKKGFIVKKGKSGGKNDGI